MRGDVAVVTGSWSIGCGHCAAICPADAVTVGFIDEDALRFATFKPDDRFLAPGAFDTSSLVRLMRSRRSCRNYQDLPVPREALEDLVMIGSTAPSGTNCQLWTFTILPDREAVLTLGTEVAEFFRSLNRKAENSLLRLLSRIFMKDALGEYYRDWHESVAEGLREWDEEKRDRLFHGAPAAILVGSRPGASFPADDALLASQNMLLAAHSMGLGTCMVGFIVEALRYDPSLAHFIGLGKGEMIHAAIAIGYPDEPYQLPAGRRRVRPRFFSPGGGT
jgi:nitroreductase